MNRHFINTNARAQSGAAAFVRVNAILALPPMCGAGGARGPGEGDVASP